MEGNLWLRSEKLVLGAEMFFYPCNNSHIIKEAFKNQTDKFINFWHWMPPLLTVPREGGLVVLIAPVCPARYILIHLSFVWPKPQSDRPFTPRPPWDLSIHTCKDAQGKHEASPGPCYDTCTSGFSLRSHNSMLTRPLTPKQFGETWGCPCTCIIYLLYT